MEGEVVRLRKWRNNNMFENLEERSEILLSLDSKYLAHRKSKNQVEIFDIENEIASISSISEVRHFLWTEIGSSSEETRSALVFTTLSNDIVVRDPSASTSAILRSSAISKYLGRSSFRILLLCIDPRLNDAFSTHRQYDECILIVDVGKLCLIRFNASSLGIESATYLLGRRVPYVVENFKLVSHSNTHALSI